MTILDALRRRADRLRDATPRNAEHLEALTDENMAMQRLNDFLLAVPGLATLDLPSAAACEAFAALRDAASRPGFGEDTVAARKMIDAIAGITS